MLRPWSLLEVHRFFISSLRSVPTRYTKDLVSAKRKILRYGFHLIEENRSTEFIRLGIDANGNYRAELPVGINVIDIYHIGIDSAADLPKKIKITEQGVTRLDIDAGIR